MVETLKILGQVKPGAATNTILYTVPDKTRTVVSTLAVCETASAVATFHVYIVPSGGAASSSNGLYSLAALSANDTFTSTIGITLGPGDFIVVSASTADICFQAFGSELSLK